ncbi:unnamed protein product [Effrenium voratum]|nr:unnamed protein product [Effrenium voratum]
MLSFFPVHKEFEDVGCVGSGPDDVGPGYYETFNQSSLDACKTFCIFNVACVGIEYSHEYNDRCRVWTRPEGVGGTVDLIGYVCLKYNHTISEGNYCKRFVRVQPCYGLEHEDCYRTFKKSSPFGDFPSDSRPKLSMLGSSLLGCASAPQLKAVRAGSLRKLEPKRTTEFRRAYERGDLPLFLSYEGVGRKVAWKAPLDKLDYFRYMPLLVEGLREREEPYCFLASQGLASLLQHGGPRIAATVPQLVLPLKAALNTRDEPVVARVLLVLQALVRSSPEVGEALVPYYRQILPIFNVYKDSTTGTDASIDYSQRKRQNLGELVAGASEPRSLGASEPRSLGASGPGAMGEGRVRWQSRSR